MHTRAVDGIVAIGPDGGEKISRTARSHRILAELDQFELVELHFGPGFEGVEPHSHDDFVDSFYVLLGEAEFQVGDERHRAGPGSFVAAPPGVVHGFWNAGDGELVMLNVHAPKVGFAERLRRG